MTSHLACTALLLASAIGLSCSSAYAPSQPITPAAAPAPVRTEAAAADADAGAPEVCEVVCEGAQVSAGPAGGLVVVDAESHTRAETENANAVMEALNDELLACYRSSVRRSPRGEGQITFDILVGSDGRVRRIDADAGASLALAKDCMEKVIAGAVFAAPHGGGTLNIRIPFSLRLNPDDSI